MKMFVRYGILKEKQEVLEDYERNHTGSENQKKHQKI